MFLNVRLRYGWLTSNAYDFCEEYEFWLNIMWPNIDTQQPIYNI